MASSSCPMDSCFVSVVSPFYNRREWLAGFLANLEQQTFRNFEVIVVDDGSSDNIADAVTSAMTSFPLRCIRLDTNKGAGCARNAGIDAARGRYIAFLDSDDLWHKDKLQLQVEQFEAAGDRESLVGLSRQTVLNDYSKYVRPGRLMNRRDRVGDYLFSSGGLIQSSSIFLTTALAKSARFDEVEPGHDDWTFALRLEAKGARFEMLPQPLVYYRDDPRPDRRSPHQFSVSHGWLDRNRAALGEKPYFSALATFASRVSFGVAAAAPLKTIVNAYWNGAIPFSRAAYYLATSAFPGVRKLGVRAKQAWLS